MQFSCSKVFYPTLTSKDMSEIFTSFSPVRHSVTKRRSYSVGTFIQIHRGGWVYYGTTEVGLCLTTSNRSYLFLEGFMRGRSQGSKKGRPDRITRDQMSHSVTSTTVGASPSSNVTDLSSRTYTSGLTQKVQTY